MPRKLILIFVLSVLIVNQTTSQVINSGTRTFNSSDFFRVQARGQLNYSISKKGIDIIIAQGELYLNSKPMSYSNEIITSITLSLSKRTVNGWTRGFESNDYIFNQPIPTAGNPYDISCLPEIQCLEFFIAVAEDIDYSQYWITMNIWSTKRLVWHSHADFLASSFVE